jgi:broad specificity phosphatase PhoE
MTEKPQVFQNPVIYLARHGTPEWNQPGMIYHLPPGPALTEKGLEEAAELAEFFQKIAVYQYFTSPLERCLRTAMIVQQKLGAVLETRKELIEVQPGEADDHILARAWSVFQEACAWSKENGPAALVTHGGVVRVMLLGLGLDPASMAQYAFDHGNPVPPAGAWRVDGLPDGGWNLNLEFVPGKIVVPQSSLL